MNITKASSEDAPLIVDLMIEGTKEGHYATYTEEDRYLLVKMMKRVITDEECQSNNGLVPSTITVIKRFDETVGFCWTLHHTPANEATVIKAMSIKKDSRGKGNGKRLIDYVLKGIPSNHMIMATCTEESSKMYDLLTHRKFIIHDIPGATTRPLVRMPT